MKRLLAMLTLALFLMAGSCGSSSRSNSVNGNWSATLLGNSGSPSFAFSMTLSQQSNNSVSVANLNFTTTSPCFTQGSTTASGGFTLNGNFNGVTNGTLTLVVQSSPNTLTLNGTVNDNTAAGTWTLTGSTSGCTGSGTFTMLR
jgi:hypothetical protein